MSRALIFLVFFAAFSTALIACGERCQINDPRAECNAYGAPDKYKDANFVSTGDAAAE